MSVRAILLSWFVRRTERLVWILANAYGLRIERSGLASGEHPLHFAGGSEQLRHQVPRSCYFNTRSGAISVGANTVFGEDVKVLTGKHASVSEAAVAGVELHHVPRSGRDILIGSGCYVGSGAIIIGPVTIGDFTVIGAGAVVTKSLPDRVFAAGNPATIIRHL